jgi:hypothetical protein
MAPNEPRKEKSEDVPFHIEQFIAKLMCWMETNVDAASNDDMELTRIHVLRDKIMEVYTMMGEDMRIWAYFKGKLDDELEELEQAALAKSVPITFNYFVSCLNRVIKGMQEGEDICEG